MYLLFAIRGIDEALGVVYDIVLCAVDGRDVVVLIPEDLQAVPSLEVYRVRNVDVHTGVGTKLVEMRGQVSSLDELGASLPDGYIEVRINGRVYANGDDFSTIDPASVPFSCPRTSQGLNMFNNTGWRVGTWQLEQGAACGYMNDQASYCREDPILGNPASGGAGNECDPPGPGGSSVDGAPIGPRRTAAGGAVAIYTQPIGGGVPATASNPTDPQTMSALTTPLASVDITLCDATVQRFAKLPIVRAGDPGSQAGVVRWGDITYPLSDRFGNLPAQTWEVDLADVDGTVRGWLTSGTNRFYKRWDGRLYIENDAARLAGTGRRALARGRCVTVRTDQDLVVTLVFSDEFSRYDSPYSLDRELPHVLIGDVFTTHTTGTGLVALTNPPDEALGLPLPIIYGEASDEYRAAEDPPVTPIGICKPIYVGDFQISGKRWHGYAVCLYAVKALVAVFGSNLHPECPGSVRLDDLTLAQEFLLPDGDTWPFATSYLQLTKDGVAYRVTMFFARGVVSQAHVDGKVPLSVNVNGIETTGNGAGTLIDDGAYIVQHLLDHPILRSTKSGNWGSVATFTGGVAKIRTTDFAAVVAEHGNRLTIPGSATAEVLGAEDITNGDFGFDPVFGDSWPSADFSGTGWSWDGSKAVHTPGTAGNLRALIFTGTSLSKRVVFDLIGATAGTLTLSWRGGASTVLTAADNGTVTLTLPTIGSGVAAINFDASSAFDGAIDNVSSKSITAAAAPDRGGYRGAVIIDQRKSARDWLSALLVSYDMRIGINHHGQIVATTRPANPTLTSLTTFTDSEHVKAGSFRLTGELNSELENRLDYEAGPEPSSGRMTVPKQTLADAQSISNWADTYKAQPQVFLGIYRPDVAANVAAQRMAVTKDGITPGQFVVDLAGGDIVGGQMVRLTHYAGLGTTGWRQRLLLATSRVLHLNEDDLSTTVSWEDQNQSYVAPAGMVGGGVTSDGITTSRIGFHPVGNDVGDTGWVVGNVSDGTAWRVG